MYPWIDSTLDGPVDDVDKMAGTDQADGGNEEVSEVEPLVGLVRRLNHFLVEVIQHQQCLQQLGVALFDTALFKKMNILFE